MILDLNIGLKLVDNYRYRNRKKDVKARTLAPNNAGQYDYKQQKYLNVKEANIGSSIPEECSLTHANYTEYLCQCYASHRAIVLTPDVIWHTVLNETAKVIVANPKPYANLFTTDSDKKTDITVPTDSVDDLPMDKIMLALKALVPTDTDIFFPEFTTTGDLAKLAQQAAFAEICSPYYNYMTFACGFTQIDTRKSRRLRKDSR